MRIIRLKLEPETTSVLQKLALTYRLHDIGFIEDVYSLLRLRGNGIPDDARSKWLAEKYACVLSSKSSSGLFLALIKSRRFVLLGILKYSPVVAFLQNPVGSEIDLLKILFNSFFTLQSKLRVSECLVCSLHSECNFGKAFGALIRTAGSVCLDVEYSRMVHKDCSHKPEIDAESRFREALILMMKIQDDSTQQGVFDTATIPDPLSRLKGLCCAGADLEVKADQLMEASVDLNVNDDVNEGDSKGVPFYLTGHKFYGTSHTTGIPFLLDPKKIEALSYAQLQLFLIGRKLETLLDDQKKGLFKSTPAPTKDQDITQIKSPHDVAKLVPSQYSLSDHVLDQRLASKALLKRQDQRPEDKKQLLYVLLDTSGSMNYPTMAFKELKICTPALLSTLFILAVIRRVTLDGGVMFFRAFEDRCDSLISCRTKEEFSGLIRYIVRCRFNGMGTNVTDALRIAVKDIAEAQGELARAELLLITDCESRAFSEKELLEFRKSLGDTSLNCFYIPQFDKRGSGVRVRQSVPNARKFVILKQMEELSDNFYSLDETKTLEHMVALIGGKKKGNPYGNKSV